MKKLLGISIVAMLAVSPMMANAENISGAMYTAPAAATEQTPAPTTSADPAYGRVNISTDDQSHIASTAYVKGAYNSAIAAVNRVAANNTTSAGNGLTKDGTTFKVNLTTGANDAPASGLELTGTDGSKTLQAKVDTTSIEINSDGELGVVAGGITSTELASNSVTTAAITNGNVTFAKVASDDIIASTSNENAGIRAASSASDSKFVTEKAVAQAVEAAKTAVTVSEGAGIDVTNNKVSVDLTSNGGLKMSDSTDAATLEIDTGNGLVIDTTGDDAGKLKVKTKASNSGLTLDSNGLYVNVDGSTVEIDSTNGVQVRDGGITSAKLASDSVTTAKIADGNVTAAKLASGILQGTVRSSVTGDGAAAYTGNQTVASEQAVATEVASLKTGVTATISNSTVPIYTTWGDDSSQNATTTVYVDAPQSGYTTTPRS